MPLRTRELNRWIEQCRTLAIESGYLHPHAKPDRQWLPHEQQAETAQLFYEAALQLGLHQFRKLPTAEARNGKVGYLPAPIVPSQLPPIDPSQVTIGITAFKRPTSLTRLWHSIKRYHPALPVRIVDTGDEPADLPHDTNTEYRRRGDIFGNLSAARNAIVAECRTEFLWLMEDDFELTNSGALAPLLDVLANDPEIGIAGGALYRTDEPPREYATMLHLHRGELRVTAAGGNWQATESGTLYRHCDQVWNYFVGRRECLLDNPWDEDLPLHEHASFFWTLKQSGKWLVTSTPDSIALHHRERNPAYAPWRQRAKNYAPLLAEKYGINQIDQLHRPWEVGKSMDDRQDKPNVVIVGTGRCGSTIFTRMLGAVGWNLGNVDDEYCEEQTLWRITRRTNDGKGFDSQAAIDALAGIPQPWAVKDPAIIKALPRWLPVLAPYRPMLVWIVRGEAAVKRSLDRQGWGHAAYNQRMPMLEREFARWPWAKVRVEYERLAEAVGMFDVGRASGATPLDGVAGRFGR